MIEPITSENMITAYAAWHASRPNARRIMEQHASEAGITVDQMIAKNRAPDLVRIRKACIVDMRDNTDLSLPQIGRMLGGRDHTTILNALRSAAGETA